MLLWSYLAKALAGSATVIRNTLDARFNLKTLHIKITLSCKIISRYVSFFTVKLTLAMEGPLVSRISTMAA